MKKQITSIVIMIISILLMIFTKSIPMIFSAGPTERITRYYSHFNLTPLGYGNWLPIITAVLSVCIVALLLIGLKKNCIKMIKICLCITIFATLLSWVRFNTFSFITTARCPPSLYAEGSTSAFQWRVANLPLRP